MNRLRSPLALSCLLMLVPSVGALGPKDVYLLVNKNVPESRQIAEHYCPKRGVPHSHILSFDLPATEDVSGSVYEERLAAGLPKPAEFFGFLVTGKYTLVECYWRTEVLVSWMTVLVGDPLYNPYARNPRLETEQVKPSPAGGTFKVFKDSK